MKLAVQQTLIAIDFETTGVVGGYPDEPWQIGMARIVDTSIPEDGLYDRWLRIGDRPFSPMAPGRHHSVRKELAEAPTLSELWPEVRPWWCGGVLVAHNASTERNVIQQAVPMHSVGQWIDTLTLSRIAYPSLASHSLEEVVQALGLADCIRKRCPGREFHDALFDAVAAAELLIHLLGQEGWRDATVETLVNARPEVWYERRKR